MAVRPWWRDAVIYQVYVRSFADGNGDGAGDLIGLLDRLEYIASLGVDGIWLNPCYPSPQMDHGYDVADYFDIEPAYGDLGVFDRLVARANELGLRILMDVVPNHCSDQHDWFKDAVAAGKGSPQRERFWFRDGQGNHGDEPPNNWKAVFGGGAWTRVVEPDGSPGQWYLHTFTPWQPDFNWLNDNVVDYFDQMLKFWFDRGVDGFRVDAVTVVGKHPDLPDAPPAPTNLSEMAAWANNPYTLFWPSAHDAWRHWREVIDQYESDHPSRCLVTVAEAYTPGRPDLLLKYVEPDQFHQSFTFDLLLSPWNATSFHKTAAKSYRSLHEAGASMTWALNNHDVHRVVTRYGRADANSTASWTGNNLMNSDAEVDEALGIRRARAAALLILGLPGAAYLYMGEELALPEVLDIADSARQDPIFVRTEGREKGRDGCRVPMPWSIDPSTRFGFSTTAGVDSWMPQPNDWGERSVEVQERDGDSVLALYRRALSARSRLVEQGETIEFVGDGSDGLFAFTRGSFAVVVNTSANTVEIPRELTRGRALVVESVPGAATSNGGRVELAADSAVWLGGSSV